jgi:predicted short-subunit dehydrogenase-like oxidoreductase (DUF2520 family)
VKDDVIVEVLNKIKESNTPIVHTSGSVGADVFKNRENFGVFYPIQSFNKNIDINFNETPICIEANNSELEEKLIILAKSISKSVHFLNSKQREQLHIAAVFASNFTNHMMSISKEILNSNKMSFDLLKPLIRNTFEKIKNNPPKDVQTGPAIREDYLIIKKHLELLEEYDDLKTIYSKISNHINNNFNESPTKFQLTLYMIDYIEDIIHSKEYSNKKTLLRKLLFILWKKYSGLFAWASDFNS